MFRVLECVWTQHDRWLVALAAAIWLIGSLAFFLLLRRSRECDVKRRSNWLALAALAGGVGVWATHFVAMLAYDGGLKISFEPALTSLSVVAAIGGFWLALRSAGALSWPRCVMAGFLASSGIGLMHFTGMAAIEAAAQIHYELMPILIGTGLTVSLLSLAFLAFARLSGIVQIVLPAGLAVLGVCVLHFTGMSSTTLMPDPTLATPLDGQGRGWLIGATVAASMGLLVLTAVAAVIDRYLTDLRGLADAALEGLGIVREGLFIEANDRLASMLGVDASTLVGTRPEQWLIAADGLCVEAVRADPVEATIRGQQTQDRVLELSSHTIEYRGRACAVLAVRDLTEKKATQRQIEHLARHDVLTDLPNRALFDERLGHALARARRENDSLAVLALDLDRFKAVNDIFGHAEGDKVLQRVADILRSCVRSSDTVARIGGDEFIILQTGAAQPDGARALADRILSSFAAEMNTARDPTAVGVSLGVAVYPDDAVDAATLRHGADIALYRAKESGRGVASFFDVAMDADIRLRRALEHDLRHAILRRQLHVAYQPLVSTDGGEISGYEALLRWSHPERGEVGPDIFIPIAEETGFIVQLGEWVLREACAIAAGWPAHLSLSVNVSPVQFQIPNLVEMVQSVLDEVGLPASRLELEITESAMLKDRAAVLRTLYRFKALGIRVVMDDFGTGYSSLSNLQSFPFDKIKIDRSFVAAMEDDAAARSIIRAIVGIGRSLDLPVVAEGVETQAQHLMVAEEGCPQAQGYYFGRPGEAPIFLPDLAQSAG